MVGGFNPSETYESQWEGWHPIYEMENKIHVWNHQPDLNIFTIIYLVLLLWLLLNGLMTIPQPVSHFELWHITCWESYPGTEGRAPFLSQPAWPATYVPALVEKNGVLMVIQWNFMVF